MTKNVRPGCRIHLISKADDEWTATIYTRETNQEWVVRPMDGVFKSPVPAATAAVQWLSINEMALDLYHREGSAEMSLVEMAKKLREELVAAIPPEAEAVLIPQAEQQVAKVMLVIAQLREQARQDKEKKQDD